MTHILGYVTSDPVTSVTNARVPSPRPATAEELAGVTTMFGRLHIRLASLEPKKGNWAYHKTLPGLDDIPASSESHLWDDFRDLQEPADEAGNDMPLCYACTSSYVILLTRTTIVSV